MSKNSSGGRKVTIPEDVRRLLGPVELLDPEIEQRRQELLQRLADDIDPQNFVVWMLVNHAVDSAVAIELLTRARYRVVELTLEQQLQSELACLEQNRAAEKHLVAISSATKLKEELNKLKADPASTDEQAQKLTADAQAKLDASLKTIDERYAGQIMATQDQLETAADPAALWREWLLPYERLDRLRGEELKRFAGLLRLINEYQSELASSLREVRNQILEADFGEQVAQSRSIASGQPQATKPNSTAIATAVETLAAEVASAPDLEPEQDLEPEPPTSLTTTGGDLPAVATVLEKVEASANTST
jgi:hypothetical protein